MAFDENRKNKQIDYEKIEILPCGEPFLTTINLFGNFGMLSSEKTADLNILFHGESSPSKITKYRFKIRPNNLRGILINNKAILKIDNLFLSEHQKTNGISNTESLKKTLGLDL